MKKNLLFALFICLIILGGSLFAQNGDMNPDAAKLYNEGITLIQAGNFEGAVAELDKALAIAQDYRIYYQKGNAFLKLKKTADAIAAFQKSIELDATFDAVYYSLGTAYYTDGKYDNAIETYKKYLTFNIKEEQKTAVNNLITQASHEKYFNEGVTLMQADNFEGAIAEYDKALAVTQDNKTYYQKGNAYLKLKKSAEAIKAFQKSIELDSTFDAGYNALGTAYFTDAKYDLAIETYEKYMTLPVSDAQKSVANKLISYSYQRMGAASKKDKKYKKAAEYLTESVKYFKYDVSFLNLAEVNVELGNTDLAIQYADSAMTFLDKITPGGPDYYKGLAYKKKGDTVKAKEFFTSGATDPKYKAACDSEIKAMAAAKDNKKK